MPHLVGALCIGLLLSPSGLRLAARVSAAGLVDGAGAFPVLTNDGFGWGIIAEYTWKEAPVHRRRRAGRAEPAGRATSRTPRAPSARAAWQRLRHGDAADARARRWRPPRCWSLAFAAASYEVPRLLGQPFPATLPVVALQRFRDTDLPVRPQAMAIATILACSAWCWSRRTSRWSPDSRGGRCERPGERRRAARLAPLVGSRCSACSSPLGLPLVPLLVWSVAGHVALPRRACRRGSRGVGSTWCSTREVLGALATSLLIARRVAALACADRAAGRPGDRAAPLPRARGSCSSCCSRR